MMIYPFITIKRTRLHLPDDSKPLKIELSTTARIKCPEGVWRLVVFNETLILQEQALRNQDDHESGLISKLIMAVEAFRAEPTSHLGSVDPDQTDEIERIKNHNMNPIMRAKIGEAILKNFIKKNHG